MADTVDLSAEFEAPAKVSASPTQTTNESVDLMSEYAPPPKPEEHAIINDAADKAHQFKKIAAAASDPNASPETRQQAAKATLGLMFNWFGDHFTSEVKENISKQWETLNTNLVNLPQAPEASPEELAKYPAQPYIAGAYNGAARVASGLTTPLNIGTLGAFGALTKLASSAGAVGTYAKAALTAVKAGFAAQMAKGAGEAAGAASVPEGKTPQEQTASVVEALGQSAMAALAAHSAGSDLSTQGETTNAREITSPAPLGEQPRGPEGARPEGSGRVEQGVERTAPAGAPAPQEAQAPQEAPVDIGDRSGRPTGAAEDAIVAEQKRLIDEHLANQAKAEGKPVLADELTPPAAGTEEHAAITEELAKQSEPSAEPLPTEPPKTVTGIRNAVVDQEREARGLPPAMEAAAKEFGATWDEALKKIDENPNAALDLVNEVRDKPRPLTDTENALLLHRQIDLQNQFERVRDRINEGDENTSPEQKASDQVQLARLSDDLLDIYNVGRLAGTEQGRGLAARKMLAAEDFSLAAMETARRAANDGKPLTKAQSDEVAALHEKIAATQKAFDDYVAANKPRRGTSNTDRNIISTFIAEKANAARERIKARALEGRVNTGLDPAELADYAIIGADYLAKGIEKTADWGEAMVKEFGEKIREHLATIRQKAEDEFNAVDSQKSRLKSFKTRAQNTISKYQDKLAEQDFEPSPKPEPLKLDAEAERLKAEAYRAKVEFQAALIQDRLNNRSSFEKAQDTLVKWRRGFLLSGPGTLIKLTAAAVNRVIQTPIEEGVGAAIGAVAPDVAAKAPRQGGLNTEAEAAALSGAFFRGLQDAAQTLKTGHSDLDVLYGKGAGKNVRESDVLPRSVIDFFGSLHGALKAPVKRAEFERSFEKRMAFAIKEGADVTDPMVQTKIAVDAYKDANRAIFMQDNVVTDAWNAGIARLTKLDKEGNVSGPGKMVATTMRVLLPIVKVPTNIVAETFETATGSVTGSIKLAEAIRNGTENLTPEQADIIMRQLKKGSLGLALLALGYFNPENAGGYYQHGDKRKPGDVKAANIRLFGVDVPSLLIHNPAIEVLQLGATIRRVADAKIKGKKKGLSEGIPSALLGLAEELPFVKTPIELGKLFNPQERPKSEGDLVRGLVVPEAVQSTARFLDKDAKGNPIRRNPKGIIENVETGIPGLRETVRKKP